MKSFICMVMLVLAASVVNAQSDDAPRYEVGALFSSLTIVEPNEFSIPRFTENTTRTEAGVGGRFTYNMTSSFAAEAEVTFFPKDDVNNFNTYTAGRATQGLFGIKAGKRFKKFGIYGKVRPGFIHFNRAVSGAGTFAGSTGGTFIGIDFGGRTNLAVDVGGVVEFYPSRRIVTRFDVGDTIVRYKEFTFDFPPPATSLPITIPGRIQNNFQFSAGVSIRF